MWNWHWKGWVAMKEVFRMSSLFPDAWAPWPPVKPGNQPWRQGIGAHEQTVWVKTGLSNVGPYRRHFAGAPTQPHWKLRAYQVNHVVETSSPFPVVTYRYCYLPLTYLFENYNATCVYSHVVVSKLLHATRLQSRMPLLRRLFRLVFTPPFADTYLEFQGRPVILSLCCLKLLILITCPSRKRTGGSISTTGSKKQNVWRSAGSFWLLESVSSQMHIPYLQLIWSYQSSALSITKITVVSCLTTTRPLSAFSPSPGQLSARLFLDGLRISGDVEKCTEWSWL